MQVKNTDNTLTHTYIAAQRIKRIVFWPTKYNNNNSNNNDIYRAANRLYCIFFFSLELNMNNIKQFFFSFLYLFCFVRSALFAVHLFQFSSSSYYFDDETQRIILFSQINMNTLYTFLCLCSVSLILSFSARLVFLSTFRFYSYWLESEVSFSLQCIPFKFAQTSSVSVSCAHFNRPSKSING